MTSGLPPIEGLVALDDATLAEWRSRLEASAYRPDVIHVCESLLPMFPVERVRLPLIHRLLRGRGDSAALLARLWSYDDAVESAALEPVLGARLTRELISARVLEREDARVRSGFRVTPFEGLWLISDAMDAGADTVMGPGGTTGLTAHLLPAQMTGDVLDLGCGAGSLALVAVRRGASRVWGADLNSRAVAMAIVNARLNGLEAEFVTGDLFAPLQGRKFDFIVSQPPYVICPPGTAEVTYLHGGPAGDAISSRLLREAPAHLKDRALALVMQDVPVGEGANLHERFRSLIGPEADLCVIASVHSFTPDTEAAIYAMLEDPTIGERYAESAVRLRDHLDATGVREIRHVAVLLRGPAHGRDADPITCEIPIKSMPRSPGRRVDDVMAALDFAGAATERVLAGAVEASPYASFEQTRKRPVLDEEPVYKARFEHEALAVDQELSAASLLLVEKLEQAASVLAGIEAYAAAIEESPESVASAAIEFVRRGVATGLLVLRRADKSAVTNGTQAKATSPRV